MGPETAISAIALVFSAIAVGVSVYQALLNRPRVRVGIQGPVLILGHGEQEGPFFMITATNVGTQPTTITGVGLTAHHGYLVKRDRKSCVFTAGGYSVDLPYKLTPGEEAKVLARLNDEMSEDFLKKSTCHAFVAHTWAAKSKRRRVPEKIKSDCIEHVEAKSE